MFFIWNIFSLVFKIVNNEVVVTSMFRVEVDGTFTLLGRVKKMSLVGRIPVIEATSSRVGRCLSNFPRIVVYIGLTLDS